MTNDSRDVEAAERAYAAVYGGPAYGSTSDIMGTLILAARYARAVLYYLKGEP